MENTIYTVQVLIKSQEQADRFKQLCLDKDLPNELEQFVTSFTFYNNINIEVFRYSIDHGVFSLWYADSYFTTITEQEFINLLN